MKHKCTSENYVRNFEINETKFKQTSTFFKLSIRILAMLIISLCVSYPVPQRTFQKVLLK